MERPYAPAHIAGLCILEAQTLLDAGGRLDLASARRRLELRLDRVPRLRQVVRGALPPAGPALWVDASGFSIADHVHEASVRAPGDETALLEATAELLSTRLSRDRPLWELWFLTGLAGGRLGALFKIHHAIADGLAAVALMSSLLDFDPGQADPEPRAFEPAPRPRWASLVADNARTRAAAAGRAFGHPGRSARAAAQTLGDLLAMRSIWSAAPITSFNRSLSAARAIRVVHLDLPAARELAHAHSAKANDVLLAAVAGAMRIVLAARGEQTEGVALRVSIPAALREAADAGALGNEVGALVASLPLDDVDAGYLLSRVAASTREAKAGQHRGFAKGLMAWLAAVGVATPFAERQRMVNLFVTNVPGPTVPLYLLGARIDDVYPVVGLNGNVTIMFAAFSYCDRLNLVVNADARSWPDLDVLVAGVEETWQRLQDALP